MTAKRVDITLHGAGDNAAARARSLGRKLQLVGEALERAGLALASESSVAVDLDERVFGETLSALNQLGIGTSYENGRARDTKVPVRVTRPGSGRKKAEK